MSAPRPLASPVVDLLDRFAVVITLAAILVAWELAVDLAGIPRYVLPAPSDIWASMAAHAGSLLVHSWVTLLETLAGFGVSLAVGIPLAVLIVSSRIFDRILYPILVASQAVPKVALAPILLVALGYSLWPKIIVAFLIAFFPVVVNTVSGLASVDRDTLNLMRSMGASKMDVFLKVRFPHAVPSMIAGFKVAIALAVVGAVVGEFVGSNSGIGYVMQRSIGTFDLPTMFAALVILALLGVILFWIVDRIERLVLPWHVSQREEIIFAS